MKKIFILCCLIFVFYSCEDAIEVDLNESEPRLVIDAKLLTSVETGESIARVRLTETIPFFENETQTVDNAVIEITDNLGNSFPLTNAGNGRYSSTKISPDFQTQYTVTISVNNQIYQATNELQAVPPLEFVEQNNEGGFSGDEIELKAFFTDPEGEDNYYYFEGLSQKGNMRDAFFDEFFDGNSIFGFYFVDDLEAGDEVTFLLNGVDEQFYNYAFTLLQQVTDQSSGPFQTQPATVRGNFINQTNIENYALGYFRASQVSILTYTIE